MQDQNIKTILWTLSDLCIQNPIGRGAGSFVCRIVHRTSNQDYACKIIQKQKDQQNQIQRIQNEVTLHSSLQHENIVKMIQYLEDQDNHYIIMELCQNEFYTYLKSKSTLKLSEQETRYYGYQLIQGLHYLHQKNIIHRDLKLGNLLIKDKILKIGDFGLASQLKSDEEERNTLCGTPNYISPEILNKQPYGKQVDLWSLGCCLYAMINGRGPFESPNHTSLGEVLKKVKIGQFDLPQGTSDSFQDLLRNLISVDPNSRYSTEEVINHPFFKESIIRTPKIIQHSRSTQSFMHKPTFMDKVSNNKEETPNLKVQIERSQNNQSQSKISIKVQNQQQEEQNDTFGINDISETQEKSQQQPNLRQLINFSPFQQSNKSHRQCNSFLNFTSSTNKVVNQFLQQQQQTGTKKLIFGMTTIGKQPSNRSEYQSGSLPKFSLQNAVSDQQNDQVNQQFAREIIKKLGLDEDKENNPQIINLQKNICTISPLKLNDLKPCKLQTKHGVIRLDERGDFYMELSNNIHFKVSDNGNQISVQKDNKKVKQFKLPDLPSKLQKFYYYSKQVCSAIREKAIKYKIENDQGKFLLRQGKNALIFEVSLKNPKLEIQHTLNTHLVTINFQKDKVELDIEESQKDPKIKDEYKNGIKIMLKYLQQCLKDKNSE